jgi:hypothetical protein
MQQQGVISKFKQVRRSYFVIRAFGRIFTEPRTMIGRCRKSSVPRHGAHLACGASNTSAASTLATPNQSRRQQLQKFCTTERVGEASRATAPRGSPDRLDRYWFRRGAVKRKRQHVGKGRSNLAPARDDYGVSADGAPSAPGT